MNNTPYLTLASQLGGGLSKSYKEKWPRYIEGALYLQYPTVMNSLIDNKHGDDFSVSEIMALLMFPINTMKILVTDSMKPPWPYEQMKLLKFEVCNLKNLDAVLKSTFNDSHWPSLNK